MPAPKYIFPNFLKDKTTQKAYTKWLDRRASSHFKRDKKCYGDVYKKQQYKEAIHDAVCNSGDRDAYTGKDVDWTLISTFNNKEAQKGGWEYIKKFAEMPTVDHVNRGENKLNFSICSWRVNDSKNNMTLEEFINLAKDVIKFNKK